MALGRKCKGNDAVLRRRICHRMQVLVEDGRITVLLWQSAAAAAAV